MRADAVAPSTPIATEPWPTSQPTGDHFSNDGSVSAIRNASSRKPVTPEEEERADEDPVADLVVPARVAARDPVDAACSRAGPACRSRFTAMITSPTTSRAAEDVEEQRVAEVERPVPEVQAEHGLGEVVLEGEDPRADEEHDEAVEDQRVREPGDAVAALDPGVREDDPGRPRDALQRPVGGEARPARAGT